MALRLLITLILFQALVALAIAEPLPNVRFLLSNGAPYIGQEVVLTVEVRYNQRPGGLMSVRWPTPGDCVSIDLPAPPPRREESTDGPLLVESARRLLRPLKAGTRALEGGIEIRDLFLPAPPLSLRVRPLPGTGRPAEFAGSVGSVELELSATGTGTREIEVKLRGNAPLDAFPPPRPQPGRSERLVPLGDAFSGAPGEVRERSFRFLYLPGEGRRGGLKVALPVFDPVAGKYKLLQAGLPANGRGVRIIHSLIAIGISVAAGVVIRRLLRKPKSIQHLLAVILGRSPAGLSRDCILAELDRYGIPSATRDDLANLWRVRDRYHFAPDFHTSEPVGLSTREIQIAQRLANDIDKNQRIP